MDMTYTHNVSAYVEAKERYGSDKVKVELAEGTTRVQAYPVDVYGNRVADKPNLADKTFSNLGEATEYYLGLVAQLREGDIIRSV